MPPKPEIYIKNRDVRIQVNPAYSLLNNFRINQIPIQTICGGKAKCGRCRIKIIKGRNHLNQVNNREKKRLGEELIDGGWRLSCQTHALRDVTVEIPGVDEDLSEP